MPPGRSTTTGDRCTHQVCHRNQPAGTAWWCYLAGPTPPVPAQFRLVPRPVVVADRDRDPNGPPLHDIPSAPKDSTVRCHWATDTNPDSGATVLVFVPGCSPMLLDPEHQQCACDTLARRLEVQVEQRRDCDAEISALRRRLKVWCRAGAAAYGLLTGSDRTVSHIHPEELAGAVRRATAKERQ